MTRQGGYFASKMCFIASLMKHIIVLKVPRLLWTFNYRLQYIFDPARKFSAMIILFLAFSIIQIEIPQFRVEKMEKCLVAFISNIPALDYKYIMDK